MKKSKDNYKIFGQPFNLFRFMYLVRGKWPLLIVFLFTTAGYAAIQLAHPWLTKILVDDALYMKNYRLLISVSVGFFLLFLSIPHSRSSAVY